MIKEFTTSVNNANKIFPPMYVVPEVYDIEGKKIIYIRIPEGTQVRRLNGRIWDRTYEGDIDITDNAELVYKMYARKQNTYFVNKVFPYLGLEYLDYELIQRAKKMAVSRVDNHPWKDLSEEEILRSMGLILVDADSGKEGITLAAILLFGKDSTIMSVLPQYKTDAIYRVKNLDRYDDRDVVCTNLIDSYIRLMEFGKKHLNDSFVLDEEQSISARDKILREIISNILAHRDYSNAYTAKLVIERDKMYTENSTPVFEEGNIFRIAIPLEAVAQLQVGPNEGGYDETTPKTTPKTTLKTTPKTTLKTTPKTTKEEKIIELLKESPGLSKKEMANIIGLSVEGVKYHIKNLVKENRIEYVGSSKKGYWLIK